MARGTGSRNQKVVPGAYKALDQFKYEIAREIGLGAQTEDHYWGEIPSRDCGAVGGHMVKRMIELAEQQLAQGGTATLPRG